jgi:hypothetical protein
MRFWQIRMKVERKMASTEVTIAKITKEGSNCGTPGMRPRLKITHKPNRARCK